MELSNRNSAIDWRVTWARFGVLWLTSACFFEVHYHLTSGVSSRGRIRSVLVMALHVLQSVFSLYLWWHCMWDSRLNFHRVLYSFLIFSLLISYSDKLWAVSTMSAIGSFSIRNVWYRKYFSSDITTLPGSFVRCAGWFRSIETIRWRLRGRRKLDTSCSKILSLCFVPITEYILHGLG